MTASSIASGMQIDGSSITAPAGIMTAQSGQPLFALRSADMTLTSDQAFTKVGSFTNYAVTSIWANRKTGAGSVACAGGIYTAATKGGDALVSAVQSWVTLAANKVVQATLAALVGTNLETATPILSLTTGSSAALTADIFIFGVVLD